MNSVEVLVNVRNTIIKVVSDLSVEKLNKIPAGFNNNIAWNFGNLLVSQQNVLYRCAGLPIDLDERYFPLYKGGTKPEQDITQEEFDKLKELFITQTEKMKTDFDKKIFTEYKVWHHAMTGIEIDTLETAIQFLTFHESLHLGYIMAIKRSLSI